jgi:hypothetical protein
MGTILLFFEWYYKDIPQKFYKIWSNYVWFWGYYFSLGNTLRTFFSPWKRIYENYGSGFDIQKWLSALVWNLFSCFMGMLFRSCLLAVFLIAEFFSFAAGFLFLILWPIFPLILITIFIIGYSYAKS